MMMKMTKLEELINELCSDGVEYKTIGEIATYRRGSFPQPYTNPLFYGGEASMPFVQVADIENEGFKLKENTKQTISKIAQPKSVFVPAGTVICSIQGTIGRVAITQYDAYIDRTIAIFETFKIEVDKRFFAYCIELKFGIEKLFARGSTLKTITKEEFTRFKIPVPPLEVQNEIVNILDNFTELTAELTARQKQYAFYRDYLLNFSNEDVTKKIPDIDCSNVEYKRLGDIATAIYRGAGIKRDEVTETGIPCVRYGEIYTTYNVTFNNCVSHTDEDKIQNKKYFEHGDVLFAITGESVEEIAKSCVYLGHDKCLAGGDIVVLKHNQNPKYMAYVLSTTNAQSQKSKGKVKSKVVHSSVPAISDIIIPIPPLAEQEKIANMIERFDHLCNDISNGLPAEIEARKKQYEYYRDTLLSFDDKACSHIVKVERERELTRIKAIKWLELQDILKIKNGKDYKSFNTGNYPVYGSGGIMAYVDTFAYDKPSVLIPRKGSIDKLYYVDVPFWNVDTIFYTDINNEIVLTKYVYYWLQKEHLEKLNTAGGVPSLTQTVLNKVKIAVPPLEEQERIVSILDRFDKLCNDISEGLPAEIEARQKQYEYYRDKLLTFKEKIVY